LNDRIVLSRRRALAGLAAAIALAPGAALAQGRPKGMDLTIVYVGAKDCGPCQVFKHQDFPQWAKSAFPGSVRFVEIEAPTTTVAYQARYWPSNVRFVLQQVKVPIVPTFFLLDGNTIVQTGSGVGGWRNKILPMIPGMLSGEWFRGYQRLG
jgi:thiol-disulfide isomerase/thioredoxin